MFFALGAEVRGREGPQRASCLLASMVDLFLALHRGFAVFGKFVLCVLLVLCRSLRAAQPLCVAI